MTMILENTGLDNLTCTLAGQERSRMMRLVRRLGWIWSEVKTKKRLSQKGRLKQNWAISKSIPLSLSLG